MKPSVQFEKDAKKYIEVGKNLELMGLLSEFFEKELSDLDQRLVLLKARQNTLNSQIEAGSIYKEDANIEQVRLNQSLLSIVEEAASYSLSSYPIIPPLHFPIFQIFLKKYLSLAIALITLIIAGISTWLPSSSTEVEINLISEGVKFSLSEDWNFSHPILISDIYINELEQLVIPNEGSFDQQYEFSLSGQGMSINELNIPGATQVDLEVNEQGLHLYSLGKSVKGMLLAENGEIETDEKSWIIQRKETEKAPYLIEFITPNNEGLGDPIRLSFYPEEETKLQNLVINSLDFRIQGQEDGFYSQVLKGEISINPSGNNVGLEERDEVLIEIIETHDFSIKKINQSLEIRFKGKVGMLKVGPKGFEKNYMPSILEKLFSQYKIGMLILSFGVFVFLLLGIVRAFGKRKGYLFMLSFGLFFMPLSGFSQSSSYCDESIQPIADKQLRYQARGNLCEGIYIAKRSDPYLKLVGVQKGALKFDTEKDSFIKLKIGENLAIDSTIKVKVQSIPTRTYYQLDSEIQQGENITWNLDNVVKPRRLRARKLAVYGYFAEKDTTFYTPVFQDFSPNTLMKNNPIIVIFNANRDLTETAYEWYDLKGNLISQGTNPQNIRSGNPIIIPCPKGKSGKIKLKLLAKRLQRSQLESTDKNQANPWISEIIYIML